MENYATFTSQLYGQFVEWHLTDTISKFGPHGMKKKYILSLFPEHASEIWNFHWLNSVR